MKLLSRVIHVTKLLKLLSREIHVTRDPNRDVFVFEQLFFDTSHWGILSNNLCAFSFLHICSKYTDKNPEFVCINRRKPKNCVNVFDVGIKDEDGMIEIG